MKSHPCPHCGKPTTKIKRYSNEMTKGVILSRVYPIIFYPCCQKIEVPEDMVEENRKLQEAKILV
jgi:hypothetical protein